MHANTAKHAVSRAEPTSGAEPASSERIDAAIARSERLAELLDTRFSIPGTPIRFGLDTLIGLVPVIGDSVTAGLGLVPVVEAARLGVRKRTIARMLANVGIDWAIGLIPGVDIVFDTLFKANVRNANILSKALRKQRDRTTKGSARKEMHAVS